jgi:hypothetical protein
MTIEVTIEAFDLRHVSFCLLPHILLHSWLVLIFGNGLVPISFVPGAFVVITWPHLLHNTIVKVSLTMLGTIILHALP